MNSDDEELLEEIKAGRELTYAEKKIHDRITGDRFTLNEIMITAVIFGLTLNLFSDFLSNFPSNLGDSFALAWSGSLAIISFLGTLFLFTRLVRRYLSDDCVVKGEFKTLFFWDRSSGTPIELDVPYGPQFELVDFTRRYPNEQVELMKKELKESDFTEGVPDSLLVNVFEKVLFNKLSEWGPYAGIDEDEYSIQQVLGVRNPLFNDRTKTALFIPGEIRTNYKFEGNQGLLEITWTGKYQGKLRVSFRSYVDMVALGEKEIDETKIPRILAHFAITPDFDRGVFAATFRVTLEAKFSPLLLQLGMKHVEDLIVWTTIRNGWLAGGIGWDQCAGRWRDVAKGAKEFREGIFVPKKLSETYDLWKSRRKEQAGIEDEKTTAPDKYEPKKDTRESKDNGEKAE